MTEIQSVILDKNFYSLKDAHDFIKRNKFKLLKTDETKNFYRFRQNEPDKYKLFRIKNIKPGVKFVIGIK